MIIRTLFVATFVASTAWAAAPTLRAAMIGRLPATVQPDAAAPTLHQLATGAGALAPLDASGNPEWPCFTGNAVAYPDCSSIPTGGLVIGMPAFTLSLEACTQSPSIPCTWLFYIVEDDNTATSELKYSVKVTQDSKVLFDTGTVLVGPNATGVYAIGGNAAFGPGNCPSTETCVAPVSGAATIEATTTVGGSRAKSTAHIVFQ